MDEQTVETKDFDLKATVKKLAPYAGKLAFGVGEILLGAWLKSKINFGDSCSNVVSELVEKE